MCRVLGLLTLNQTVESFKILGRFFVTLRFKQQRRGIRQRLTVIGCNTQCLQVGINGLWILRLTVVVHRQVV